MTTISKIGVITGGGDCPGLNAVIRAVVKSAINLHGLEVIGFLDGFKGLVENRWIRLDWEKVSGILHIGGTILGSSNRDNPFAYYGDNSSQPVDMSGAAIENLQALGIDALVVIGGDGSMHIAQGLADKGLKVVGVPKTIDNDLMGTDFTFGFHTAVDTASEALDRLHTTAESHHRVMILEVMGRYAGWIALYAGISGGADVILIPEIPYEVDKVIEKIRERYIKGRKFSIVVIAEGAVEKGGQMVVRQRVEKSHDPVRLGGNGQVLADCIENLTGIESRVTVLGHLQRGGTAVPFDRILSTRYGVAAVDILMKGLSGRMVALSGTRICSVPIAEAIKTLKRVDPGGEMVRAARAVGVSMGD